MEKIKSISVYTQNNVPLFYTINDNKDALTLTGLVNYILMYDDIYADKVSIGEYEVNNVKFLTLIKNNSPIISFTDIKEYDTLSGFTELQMKEEFLNQRRIFELNNIDIQDKTREPYIKIAYINDNYDYFLEYQIQKNKLSLLSEESFNNFLGNLDEVSKQNKEIVLNDYSEINFNIESSKKDFNKINDNDRLKIEKSILPDAKYISKVWNLILKDKGVNLSINKIENLYEQGSKMREELNNKICSTIKETLFIREDLHIDYNSRKLNKNSLANYLVRLAILENFYLKQKSVKVTLSDLKNAMNKYKSNTWQVELLQNIYDYMKVCDLLSDIYKFRNTYQIPNCPAKDRYEGNINGDNLVVYPSSNVLTTNRIQIVTPNLQGLQPKIKECIGYSDSSKSIISMDIKGQDTHVLIFGVLKDPELTKATIEFGDPILGILKRLNYPTTPENRKTGKLPVLGLMNGKALNTILTTDVHTEEDKEMVTAIYNFITNNPNYKHLREEADRKLRAKEYTKSCLLGIENELNVYDKSGNKRKDYTLRNAIINANFQMTSASIFNLSTTYLIYDLINGNIEYNGEVITMDVIRPLFPIFDEIVFECKEGYEELTKKIMKYYFLPYILEWEDTMKYEITCGNYYIHK